MRRGRPLCSDGRYGRSIGPDDREVVLVRNRRVDTFLGTENMIADYAYISEEFRYRIAH